VINMLGTLGVLFDVDLDPTGKGLEYLGGLEQTAATGAALGPVFFDSLPFLVITGRVVWTGTTSDVIGLRFNGDAGANYWFRTWTASGTGAVFTSAATGSAPMVRIGGTAGTGARTFLAAVLNIEGTTSPLLNQVSMSTGSAATIGALQFGSGEYVSTNLINSVSLHVAGGTASFGADTGFAVFGAAI
jgi:hypothetical protein